MSVWRRKAIDCLPECKKDFEQPGVTIYEVFRELLPAAISAHQSNDNSKIQKIYAFAEWCFQQKEKDLWNAAGVCFYEHLFDHPETREAFPQQIKKETYTQIRVLLELSVEEEKLKVLDRHYI